MIQHSKIPTPRGILLEFPKDPNVNVLNPIKPTVSCLIHEFLPLNISLVFCQLKVHTVWQVKGLIRTY